MCKSQTWHSRTLKRHCSFGDGLGLCGLLVHTLVASNNFLKLWLQTLCASSSRIGGKDFLGNVIGGNKLGVESLTSFQRFDFSSCLRHSSILSSSCLAVLPPTSGCTHVLVAQSPLPQDKGKSFLDRWSPVACRQECVVLYAAFL